MGSGASGRLRRLPTRVIDKDGGGGISLEVCGEESRYEPFGRVQGPLLRRPDELCRRASVADGDNSLWNAAPLPEAVEELRSQGESTPEEKFSHLSPLGWEHITLTAIYHWNLTPTSMLEEFVSNPL